MSVDGFVAPGFEAVADAFAANDEANAQCCVSVDGTVVVDLWTSYGPDALQVVFSATKGATAACANLLVQRGALDLDGLVTDLWPAYGAEGKGSTLVRWMLTHKAGVVAPAPGLTFDDIGDWTRMCDALAAATPAWEPGTAYGYHAVTFGWLVGELVRRADPAGRGLGRFFAEELAGPAGAAFFIGLPASEEPRLADVIPFSTGGEAGSGGAADIPDDLRQFIGPLLLPALSLNGAIPDLGVAALDRRFRAAELGGAGGVASGRGLCRLYAFLLDAFTAETIADILVPETSGIDQVISGPMLGMEQRFGRGFAVQEPSALPAGLPTFGHGGAGGSMAWAEPANRVAFGYAMTKMVLGPPNDARPLALVDALYRCL